MCNSRIGEHNTHGLIGRSQVPKALSIASLYLHVTDSVPDTLYIPPTHNGGTPVSIIFETLEAVKFGEPIRFENMEMFPLIAESDTEFDYDTLDEALKAGTARITETSDSGSVPELTFLNEGEAPVFLMDGEELVGAKQNRVLNLSIMAPAGKTITIPVSCVEAGRWAHSSDEFRSGDRAQYASARASKSRSVSGNIRASRQARSDQPEVWADISAKSMRMESASPTGAMSAMYEKSSVDLESFVEKFKGVDGQLGFVFLIDGVVAGLDLFDTPETLRKLMPKLVKSYALDALDTHARRLKASGHEELDSAEKFIGSVKEARMAAFPSVGMGEDYRPPNGSVTGGALVIEGTLIHLGVFPGVDVGHEEKDARGALLARASRRRRAH